MLITGGCSIAVTVVLFMKAETRAGRAHEQQQQAIRAAPGDLQQARADHIEHAGFLERAADHEDRAEDDDDVIAESGERLAPG